MRAAPALRTDYVWFTDIPTRWHDNDIYGHINNVVFYAFFDTAVNRFLIEEAGLDIHKGAQIGLVVETSCQYFSPLSFPQSLEAGLKVAHIGRTSVSYDIGVFAKNTDKTAARGRFVHVYVDRESRRPMPLSAPLRRALETITGCD